MTTGTRNADRADQCEDGVRDRLLPTRYVGLDDRRRSSDREQEVLWVRCRQHDARAESLRRVETVDRPIHFGIAACSSPCGLPRHCFAAISTSNAPSTNFSVLAHVAGVPPSLVPLGETSSTIAPTSESPSSQPTTNAGPLARARGVTSIRTTPMIGIGLIATPTASDRI